MEEKSKKTLYTIEEMAKEKNISGYTIRHWCKTGVLKHLKSGNRYYVTLPALDALIDGGMTAR